MVLRQPEHASAEHRVDWDTQMYFDGGSQRREGTGGYVIWDVRGVEGLCGALVWDRGHNKQHCGGESPG